MSHCTSTQVSVLQKAVHPEPATCITVLQQKFLSNKTQFIKNQQRGSLYLNRRFCPTRRISPRTSNLCLDLPVHERLSKKRQFTKNHLSGLYLPVHERLSNKRQFTKNHQSVSEVNLPVLERLSNKRQFTKNHQSVSEPTCARASVQQEAAQKEPPKRVCTYLCTSVYPTLKREFTTTTKQKTKEQKKSKNCVSL